MVNGSSSIATISADERDPTVPADSNGLESVGKGFSTASFYRRTFGGLESNVKMSRVPIAAPRRALVQLIKQPRIRRAIT